MNERHVKLHALVVEDHYINQELMREMLLRLNCSVDTVENGIEALAALESNVYDVIFMDLQMPEMDGFDATREIRRRERERKTPIIALTANAMHGERGRCLDAGMNDYLSKPFELQDIEALIKKHFPD